MLNGAGYGRSMLPKTRQQVGELLRGVAPAPAPEPTGAGVRAEISSSHLTFVETGRSQPSREMLQLLSEKLDVPLRDCNVLLVAAGYAPIYPERRLDDPELESAREAIRLVLEGHEPSPALAVDRHWNLVTANRAMAQLIEGAAPELLQPPVNVLRLSLHPDGLAPRIVNFAQWRGHLLDRLRHQLGGERRPHADVAPPRARGLAGILLRTREWRRPAGRCRPASSYRCACAWATRR